MESNTGPRLVGRRTPSDMFNAELTDRSLFVLLFERERSCDSVLFELAAWDTTGCKGEYDDVRFSQLRGKFYKYR